MYRDIQGKIWVPTSTGYVMLDDSRDRQMVDGVMYIQDEGDMMETTEDRKQGDTPQLTVRDLRRALEPMDGDLPVFFRKIAPVAGNIQEAVWVNETNYHFFGLPEPCVIIETWSDEE